MIIESVMLFGQGGTPHGGRRREIITLNYVTYWVRQTFRQCEERCVIQIV